MSNRKVIKYIKIKEGCKSYFNRILETQAKTETNMALSTAKVAISKKILYEVPSNYVEITPGTMLFAKLSTYQTSLRLDIRRYMIGNDKTPTGLRKLWGQKGISLSLEDASNLVPVLIRMLQEHGFSFKGISSLLEQEDMSKFKSEVHEKEVFELVNEDPTTTEVNESDENEPSESVEESNETSPPAKKKRKN